MALHKGMLKRLRSASACASGACGPKLARAAIFGENEIILIEYLPSDRLRSMRNTNTGNP